MQRMLTAADTVGASSCYDLLGLLEGVKRLKADEKALRAEKGTLAEQVGVLSKRVAQLERCLTEQEEKTRIEAGRSLELTRQIGSQRQEQELLQASVERLKAQVDDLTASNTALRAKSEAVQASGAAISEQLLGESRIMPQYCPGVSACGRALVEM